ncbi:hypothetical protein [Acidithiobacillus ferrooxidans]|uniref:hypothetical protein n=1 Tax=Acidithiobacillus ferrooxidans TaxID=920 RepID=UPI0035A6DA7C
MQWLSQHGYRFDLNAANRPIVLQDEVQRHLLGAERVKPKEPRFDRLHRTG